MAHAKEIAWVHHNMAMVDMTEMRQDVPAQARSIMNDALFKVKNIVLGVQGKVLGQDAATDEYLKAWHDFFQWVFDLQDTSDGYQNMATINKYVVILTSEEDLARKGPLRTPPSVDWQVSVDLIGHGDIMMREVRYALRVRG